METDTSIVIRLAGDSGDGVQLVGEQLTITAALTGRDVRTLPDFPAEIRAPQGTIAGVSGFQLAMSEKPIFTAGERLDVLVALNPAALKTSLAHLNQLGLLIINQDNMQPKDFEKAGMKLDDYQNLIESYQILSLPLITLTLKAVEGVKISHAQAKKAKNFYILGVIIWLFDLSLEACKALLIQKFKKQPEIQLANEKALIAGYNYAMTLELSRSQFQLGTLQRKPGKYRQLHGLEAVGLALATLSTRTNIPLLVSGYPITPASGILQECAKLTEYGVSLFQAEDEIAAICSAIGAAFGGCLAMACTSGPGLDLKSEGLGLAVVSELPLVLIDVQRAGASTGMPTKTSQSDLMLALYGRHGESPLPVIAANSPIDCFYTLIEAFKIAIEFMTPVIVLLDAYLANAAEPWNIPDPETIKIPDINYNRFIHPYERDEKFSRSWNRPGSPDFIHHLGGLEKQGKEGRVSYDPLNHQEMITLRAKKISNIACIYDPLCIEGHVEAETLVIGWGSTYGSLKSALNLCESQGVKLAHLQLRYLNPLPQDLEGILKRYRRIFVAELNTGHLCQLLRATYLVNAELISQCTGQPFSTRFLVETILSRLQNETLST